MIVDNKQASGKEEMDVAGSLPQNGPSFTSTNCSKTQSVKFITMLRAVLRQIRTRSVYLPYAVCRDVECSSLNVRPWNRDKTC